MDGLGDDLVLLSIRPASGRLGTAQRIDFGLMGAELVRLAALGRVEITGGRIVVSDPAPTGDTELDAALNGLARAKRPVRPKNWIGRKRRGIRLAYLNRLAASGVLRAEPGRLFGTRWFITDQARVADARARLDAIAFSPGQIDIAQAAYAGIAHVIALDRLLYRGSAGRRVRKRMAQIAKGEWTAAAVTGADGTSDGALDAAADASVRVAIQAAITGIRAAIAAASSGG